jgi:GH25 family lysozyme M1 (1,4-beta-N-acetylmuramidase)
MIDLSNNNAGGHDFKRAYLQGGQRRVYLKAVEGTNFVDRTYTQLRKAALKGGLRVGAYDFLHPNEATPSEALSYFVKRLSHGLQPGRDLRPTLDVEHGTPSAKMGQWVKEMANSLRKEVGVRPLIYGSGYFLQDCQFATAPGPLWLAAYGKNDGREYPVTMVPRPWRSVAAHQYSSNGNVAGINGHVDISTVRSSAAIELPKSLV